jgi:hypothetical protein
MLIGEHPEEQWDLSPTTSYNPNPFTDWPSSPTEPHPNETARLTWGLRNYEKQKRNKWRRRWKARGETKGNRIQEAKEKLKIVTHSHNIGRCFMHEISI